MPLLSLNHVSFVCKSVSTSVRFYQQVLGFVLIKRPSSFTFEGAWLFNYGIGIHLLESESVPTKKERINPKDNHISFQCSDMKQVMRKLQDMGIHYVTAVVGFKWISSSPRHGDPLRGGTRWDSSGSALLP
ncbi:hypothetical protein V6N13_102972 [Hibiscus sabdariffa]